MIQRTRRIVYTFATILLVCWFFTGCGKKNPSFEEALSTAEQNLLNAAPETALQTLLPFLETHNNEVRLHEMLAAAYEEQGLHADAARHYLDVVALSPQQPVYYIFAARNFLEAGDIDGAVTQYRSYLRSNPRDAEILRTLARLLDENRRFEEAIEIYVRLFAVEPEGGIAMRLGTLFRLFDNAAQAKTWFQSAYNLNDGRRAAALLALFEVAIDNKDFPEALRIYDQLEADFPMELATSSLGDRRIELDRWRQSMREVEGIAVSAEATVEVANARPIPVPEPTATIAEILPSQALEPETEVVAEPELAAIPEENIVAQVSPEAEPSPPVASLTNRSKVPSVSVDAADFEAIPAVPSSEVVGVETDIPPLSWDIVDEEDTTTPADTSFSVANEPVLAAIEDIPNLPDRTPTYANLLVKARDELGQQNFRAAAKTYWEALLIDDRSAEIWFELSSALYSDNQLPMAEKTALEAMRREPERLLYRVHFLRVAQYTMEPIAFFEELRRSYELYPNSPELNLAMARGFRNVPRDFRSASERYRDFLRLATSDHPERERAERELAELPRF